MTDGRITDEELSELERLEKAATKGPWGWYSEDQSMATLCGHTENGHLDPLEHHVVSLTICKSCQQGHEHWEWGRCYTLRAPDAKLIPAMRNALPALLAEVRRAREARADALEEAAPGTRALIAEDLGMVEWQGELLFIANPGEGLFCFDCTSRSACRDRHQSCALGWHNTSRSRAWYASKRACAAAIRALKEKDHAR